MCSVRSAASQLQPGRRSGARAGGGGGGAARIDSHSTRMHSVHHYTTSAHLICSLMAASRREVYSVRATLVITSPLQVVKGACVLVQGELLSAAAHSFARARRRA